MSACYCSPSAAAAKKSMMKLVRSNNRMAGRGCRWMSEQPSSTVRQQQQQEILRNANEQMSKYHEAKVLLAQGKLPSKNQHLKPENPGMIQAGIFGTFLILFFSMPFLGKKIATDEEFRNKYVPDWYNFTVPKPENPWTRQELHEQMLEQQRILRERAIQGDFHPDKLASLQDKFQNLQSNNNNNSSSRTASDKDDGIPNDWNRLHPGLEDGEDVDETDA